MQNNLCYSHEPRSLEVFHLIKWPWYLDAGLGYRATQDTGFLDSQEKEIDKEEERKKEGDD